MTVKEVKQLMGERNKQGMSSSLFNAISSNEPLIWFVEVIAEDRECKSFNTVIMIEADEGIRYPYTSDILSAIRKNYPNWLLLYFDIIGVACKEDTDSKGFPSCICKYTDSTEPEMF